MFFLILASCGDICSPGDTNCNSFTKKTRFFLNFAVGEILNDKSMKRQGKIKMVAGIIAAVAVVLAAAGILFINRPSFGRLPRGERLKRIEQSPHYRDGEFRNLSPTEMMTSDKGRFQVLLDFVFADRSGLFPEVPVSAVKTDLKRIPSSENCMVWFGHSSYLLQLDGMRILVDPVFHQAAPVSFVNRPFKGTDIYKPEDMPDIDCLVITHDHWDHLDYRTVTELKDRVKKVICPLGVGEHFEYWGFDPHSLVELDWREDALLDTDSAFMVRCLPARHFSGRGLRPNKSLWASFLLEAPSLTVYIGGDSGYDTHFAEIGKRYPGIDLAILENGQYNDDWRYIHLMPRYLGHAARDLKAKYLITVHHSKYALSRHSWDEPLKNELRAAKEDSLNLIVPVIGEKVSLDFDKE